MKTAVRTKCMPMQMDLQGNSILDTTCLTRKYVEEFTFVGVFCSNSKNSKHSSMYICVYATKSQINSNPHFRELNYSTQSFRHVSLGHQSASLTTGQEPDSVIFS